MALVALPVLPAVVAPALAVEKLSWLTGLREPPPTPLLLYLTAGGSLLYLILSAFLWLISLDVARYRPLVTFTAWGTFLAGPAFAWIDTQAGMPAWWMRMDSLSCVLGGSALLWALGSNRKPA